MHWRKYIFSAFVLLNPNYTEWTPHPTQKPLEICERIILASSDAGDTVFIPFAGSGSEIIACKRLGRRWLASEVDEGYCDLIEDRLASESAGNARCWEKKTDRSVRR